MPQSTTLKTGPPGTMMGRIVAGEYTQLKLSSASFFSTAESPNTPVTPFLASSMHSISLVTGWPRASPTRRAAWARTARTTSFEGASRKIEACSFIAFWTTSMSSPYSTDSTRDATSIAMWCSGSSSAIPFRFANIVDHLWLNVMAIPSTPGSAGGSPMEADSAPAFSSTTSISIARDLPPPAPRTATSRGCRSVTSSSISIESRAAAASSATLNPCSGIDAHVLR